jgi:alpha-1,2-mannosyltransferase
VLLAVAVAEALVLTAVPGRRGWFDVGVYYGTVHYWVDGGLIYDYLRPGTVYGFTYPPFAALCMLPMALLRWHTVVACSVLANVAAAAILLFWLVDPIAVRRGWRRGYTFCFAACLLAAVEPVRDTISFGQVNLLLVVLVLADLRLLASGSRFAGLGTGLATAVKLTPGLFIGYLLLARRWRAAALAAATLLAATTLAALVSPGATRVFWAGALWDTDRVGAPAYVSNQSVMGLVARLGGGVPDRAAWLAGVAVLLAIWGYRSRRSGSRGDHATGFTLTGVAACLVSPVTWVHHLVWLLPALVLLTDRGLSAAAPRRGRLLAAAGAAYVLLCSGVIWLWSPVPAGWPGLVGGNADVWVSLGLLVGLPAGVARAAPAAGPPAGETGGPAAGETGGALAGEPRAAEAPVAGAPAGGAGGVPVAEPSVAEPPVAVPAAAEIVRIAA